MFQEEDLDLAVGLDLAVEEVEEVELQGLPSWRLQKLQRMRLNFLL